MLDLLSLRDQALSNNYRTQAREEGQKRPYLWSKFSCFIRLSYLSYRLWSSDLPSSSSPSHHNVTQHHLYSFPPILLLFTSHSAFDVNIWEKNRDNCQGSVGAQHVRRFPAHDFANPLQSIPSAWLYVSGEGRLNPSSRRQKSVEVATHFPAKYHETTWPAPGTLSTQTVFCLQQNIWLASPSRWWEEIPGISRHYSLMYPIILSEYDDGVRINPI